MPPSKGINNARKRFENNPGALWRLARTTLHGEAGLPSLVLVRMQGRLADDEANLETYIAEILKPRTPPRS